MEVFPGITMNVEICQGKPCVGETAIDVATVVGMLGSGKSFEDVQDALNLTYEQVLMALKYASYVTDHLPLRMSTPDIPHETE